MSAAFRSSPGDMPSLLTMFGTDRDFLRGVVAGAVTPRDASVLVTEALQKSLGVATRSGSAVAGATSGTAVTPLGSMQQLLRPLFAKPGVKPPTFGDHPDYAHLRGTAHLERGAVTTLFMDIESSTRLGLLYPPEVVVLIKNCFICAAIEIVNAFDGHVHRIMGDAVMAFFGAKDRVPEDGAVDALNAAATLRLYVEDVIIPALRAQGLDDPFGIRVGVDFGAPDRVVWSAYGYPTMEEVTATGFPVDVASKLQHAAGRNQIMVGQALRDLLDLPDEVLRDKVVVRDGATEVQPYLLPNLTGRDGAPINYRQRLLRWETYLGLTMVAEHAPEQLLPKAARPRDFEIRVSVHDAENGPERAVYGPCGATVAKYQHLRFTVRQLGPWLGPCTVTFAVENHGREAAQSNRNGNHSTDVRIDPAAGRTAVQWESTLYRGLHYMRVQVRNSTGIVHEHPLGVYVR